MYDIIKQRLFVFEQVLDQITSLRYLGDSVLRRQATMVTLEEGLELFTKLEPVLLTYRKITGAGRGLAAPQVGESKSVFITYHDGQIELFINPNIVERSSKTNFYREQCLSTGILSCDIERPEWIVMEWMDVQGNACRKKIEGFKARLYQHEEAHLRGHLTVDDAVAGGIEFAISDPLKEQLRDTR